MFVFSHLKTKHWQHGHTTSTTDIINIHPYMYLNYNISKMFYNTEKKQYFYCTLKISWLEINLMIIELQLCQLTICRAIFEILCIFCFCQLRIVGLERKQSEYYWLVKGKVSFCKKYVLLLWCLVHSFCFSRLLNWMKLNILKSGKFQTIKNPFNPMG